MTRLTLYGRELCHLCYDMERALTACHAERDFALEIVDIDSDPSLVARFGEWIPVLMAGQTQICCYQLDRKAFDAYFEKLQ
jgi:glutaredoxin